MKCECMYTWGGGKESGKKDVGAVSEAMVIIVAGVVPAGLPLLEVPFLPPPRHRVSKCAHIC